MKPLLPDLNDRPLILLIDDVADNLKVLHGMLAPLGYRLTFAMNGPQDIERARASHPDLIVLDVMMPGMDGLEVCRRIKSIPELADVPIIFLTVNSGSGSLVQAFKEGALDFITKPFCSDELFARIATHIELSRLRRHAQLQAKQEETVREIVAAIHHSLELDRILESAAYSLQHLLVAQRVSIARCLTPQDCKILLSTDPELQGQRFTIDAHPEEFEDLEVVVHCKRPDDRECAWFERCQVEAEYRMPLYQESVLWGVGIIYLPDREMTADEAELLEPIASQLAVAIEQSELHEQLQRANAELMRLATLDGRTSIPNRRALDELLDNLWAPEPDEGKVVAAILLDIDHFKRYNDTYGHLQGDWCLKNVARALKETLDRPGEFVARYGGEEFCVVLPDRDLDAALQVARRIQAGIANLAIEHRSHPENDCVTVSIGVATTVPDPTNSPHSLIESADAALYRAKQCGRNCIGQAGGEVLS